ncbi:MAG: phosphoglycolate phosphatase [bacterium]|nr:MAG: phosphoglycolate phosphatase [bacterium]
MAKLSVDLIIFDLDGTLIDSKKDIAYAVNRTLEGMDLQPIPERTVYQYVGNGVRPLIEQTLRGSGKETGIPEAIRLFQKFYTTHLLDNTVMFDGVPEILEHFQNLGKKMAVASNKPYRYVKKIMDGLNMTRFFLSVKGGDSVEMKKPAPEMLDAVINETGADRKSSVFVGDSGIDVRTGKNARIKTVGVTYGFRSAEEIMENKPDMLIDSPRELKEIIL